jgi:alpha-N-acetylglucosaminidase
LVVTVNQRAWRGKNCHVLLEKGHDLNNSARDNLLDGLAVADAASPTETLKSNTPAGAAAAAKLDALDRRTFMHAMLAACLAIRIGDPSTEAGSPVGSPESAGAGIRGLARRVAGPQAEGLSFEIIKPVNDMDVFEVQTIAGRPVLRGNNTIAQAAALNCYLREFCNAQISWDMTQFNIPPRWPMVPHPIRRATFYQYRYFLNYCTFSYTMAFWDWPRWQRELDWMALNGINLALAAVIGQGTVWQNVMRRMGQSEQEIREFIAGPAFEPWWLMDNLEGWGGPVEAPWLEKRKHLQFKILMRMRELGIEPVLQGFYGMVPSTLQKHYPNAKIISTGDWCGFTRPPMLLPEDPLFTRMAKIWYEEQQNLFGPAKYFGGDPFHEGVVPKGVDLKAVGAGIEAAMQQARPGAVWVMQGWEENPHQRLLEGTAKDNTLILDLYCDGPSGGSYRKRDNWSGHPWVWCIINDFGGRISLYGQWDKIKNGPISARKLGRMSGIGAMMEATVGYPNFQLLYDMTWMTTPPDLTRWVTTYAIQRYGGRNRKAEAAWVRLKETVYNSELCLQSPTTSVFCLQPRRGLPIYNLYDRADLVLAWHMLLSAADGLEKVDTYRYDLVNVTRQVLDDLGQWQYQQMIRRAEAKDSSGFAAESKIFLEMIFALDQLLATQNSFLLGRWLAQARSLGNSAAEKAILERNAKTLITVWGPKPGLEDYSRREWSGMLTTFYAGRWKLWIDFTIKGLAGKKAAPIDWFKWEQAWTHLRMEFPVAPSGDSVIEARRIAVKYGRLIARSIAK